MATVKGDGMAAGFKYMRRAAAQLLRLAADVVDRPVPVDEQPTEPFPQLRPMYLNGQVVGYWYGPGSPTGYVWGGTS